MSKKVLAFNYVLTDSSGKKLDASDAGEPLSFLTGAGQIIPGLESELLKLKIGDKKKIQVTSKDAYGDRDQNLVQEVPKDRMPNGDLKVGDMLRTDHEHFSVVVITKITDSHVTIDGNHPLAGQDLTFDVEVVSERDATLEEISHGHAHGPGGHHHH